MLKYDPEERITVEQCLSHEYLRHLHYPDDEPVTNPVTAYDFDFEKYSLTKDDYKDLIYEEIMLYHSDEAAFNYINNKRKYPDGNLHLKFGNRLRAAFRAPEHSLTAETSGQTDFPDLPDDIE